MLQIYRNLISPTATGRRPGRKVAMTSITIHSNGNPKSTARSENANLVNNSPGKKVSFHFAVDDKNCYQNLPIDEMAWHAGDYQNKKNWGPGNTSSIAIEICEGGDRLAALLNAVSLCKTLMKQTGLRSSQIVQHNHWSGKDCPRILRNADYIKDGLNWAWFIGQLKEEEVEMVTKGEFEVDGEVIVMDRILKDGKNYVELTDICSATEMGIRYDKEKNRPVIERKK